MRDFCSLSEAIREGAKLNPKQCREVYTAGDATCALGAAVTALGKQELLINGWPMEFLWERFPYIARFSNQCPSDNCDIPSEHCEFLGIVAHLNDYHEWTREQIADWVETLEEKIGFITIAEPEPAQLISSALAMK